MQLNGMQYVLHAISWGALQMVMKLTSLAALASVSALGALLVVAQGQAASLPSLKPSLGPAQVQVPQATQAQPTAPDGRTVRVVYPSPFATK